MRYNLFFPPKVGSTTADTGARSFNRPVIVALTFLVTVAAFAPPAEAGSGGQCCKDPNCNDNNGGGSGSAMASPAEWNSPVQAVQPVTGPVSAKVDSATGVSASVTPATIDEAFSGFLQVSISGLTTGASVRVEKFQVNNTSGVIDATSILEQSFLLTDGKSNQIGGIANINVPADSTPADGNIVAQISFLDDSVPNTVGEYVFRFSSPANAFSPITTKFSVTAVPDAQDISGVVTANNVPVPNAYVVLLDTAGGGFDFIAATIADAAGHYSFGAQAGAYDMVAAQRGFVGAFGKGVEQVLSPNEHKTVNVTMQQGTRTISGLVRDSKTLAGLPAVEVVFRSDDGKFTVDYTDANGNFSTRVTPANWTLEVPRNAVNQIGYLTSTEIIQANTSSGDATKITISLRPVTALIYGTISDGTNPIAAAQVDSIDETGRFSGFTATGSNGSYVIAIASGVWAVNATSGALQERGDIAPFSKRLYAADGQAVRADFTAKKSNARISGSLKDDSGAGISDTGFRAINSGSHSYTDFGTDDNGLFNAAFADGTWAISPDQDDIADTNLIFVLPANLTVTAGQTLTGLAFQAQVPTRHINVQVNDNTGTAYEGALLSLTRQSGGKTYVSYGYTDENGAVSLPAFDGTWTFTSDATLLADDGFRELPQQNITVNGTDVNVTFQLQLLPATGNTLVNLSTRGTVQTGDNVLIGGFIVPGLAPKKVLVRAIGPSLTGSGINGALADPTLTLFDGSGTQIGFNDNWVDSPDKQAIIDTTIPPKNDKESAILQTLAPGNYTAKVAGVNNTAGVALVELYDLQSFSSSTLANISTRGRVNTGENVLIAGYIVGGYKSQRVVVRGLGPSLAKSGVPDVLTDPTLDLHNGQGTIIMSNNDWQDTQKQELIDTTIPPSDPKESALVINLQPGNYTAVVSGVGGGTGVGLVEVYNITPR